MGYPVALPTKPVLYSDTDWLFLFYQMESQREFKALTTKGDECAFAIPAFETPKTVWNRPQYGLTKREYFAAMAMQGLLASGVDNFRKPAVEYAVEYADDLINELNKRK